MTEKLVPSLDFSTAKASLSAVMDSVYHARQPYLVSRHHGREQMVLLGREVLEDLLCADRIEVESVVDGGEVTLQIPELGVLGFGESLDEAVEDLLVELRDYAGAYFREPARYRGDVRDGRYGMLLRFALTAPEHQRELLSWSESGDSSPADTAPAQ